MPITLQNFETMFEKQVPKSETDSHVLVLAEKLNASHEPGFVTYEDEKGTEIGDCFFNVKKKVIRSKGRMVLGWQIWLNPGLIIEAEFHAVWEDPKTGELVDITQKEHHFPEILFVEDDKLTYEGRMLDNVRMNISGNTLVDDFIRVHEANFAFMNKGDRADQYGIIQLEGEDIGKNTDLQELLLVLGTMTLSRHTKQSRCACGSGKIYDSCHGRELEQKLQRILS